MKKLYLIGNHKMNMSVSELEPYFERLAEVSMTADNVVGVCVPYVYLNMAMGMLEGSKVLYGAQNMYHQDSGAYTGEISANMLEDFSCDLVILGHSERRAYFHETDEEINLKVKKALEKGITPILCFGETLDERNAKMAFSVVERQIVGALQDLDEEDAEELDQDNDTSNLDDETIKHFEEVDTLDDIEDNQEPEIKEYEEIKELDDDNDDNELVGDSTGFESNNNLTTSIESIINGDTQPLEDNSDNKEESTPVLEDTNVEITPTLDIPPTN